MASSEVTTRDKGLASMINLSVPNIRHTISHLKSKISTRFSIRAATDTLPTYYNEYKKVLTSKAYETRYQGHINDGLCPFCNVPETLSHVLTSCQLGAQIRKETHQKIQEMWLKKNKRRAVLGTELTLPA